MDTRSKISFVLVMLVIVAYWNVIPLSAQQSFNSSTVHGPIYIVGDENFTPENGVIAGSGTRDDPYIIANWVIMANGSTPYGPAGIFIANTTKYFVIRNVTVFGGDWGVILDNVSNFVIEDSEFYDIKYYAITAGVPIDKSLAFNGTIRNNEAWNIDSFAWVEGANFIIENNYIHDLETKSGLSTIAIGIEANNTIVRGNSIENMNGRQKTYADGIFIFSPSENITIQNNTIYNIYNVTFGEGIVLYTLNGSISDVWIESNDISNVSDNGIDIDAHNGGIIDQVKVANNTISNCYWRSVLIYYNHGNITIAKNTLFNNGHHGIGVEHSGLLTIENNKISDNNERGIHILDSTDVEIINNTIYNNIQGVWIEQGSKNIYLESNNLSSNQQGMVILYSKNITMRSNVFENNMYSLGIWAGTDVSGYIHNIDTSNLINGHPIYYTIDKSNEVVPVNISFLGLINCKNITAANLGLSHEGRILIVNSSNITVRDSKLENDEYAVDVVLSKKVLFENVSIVNTGETAVTLIQTYDSNIKDTIINDANTGIYLGDSTSIFVTNVSLSSIRGWRGIAVVNGENITISDNGLENVENEWSIATDNSNNVLIFQNHIDTAKAGILSYNSTNVIVAKNTVANITSWPGIEVTVGSKNVTLIGNVLYSLNPDSISVHDCHDITIRDNLINGSWGQGIHVYRAGKVLIENNSVLNVGESGILVEDSSYNITIMNSNVYNNTGGIALISSSNVSILNSSIHDNGFPRNWSGIYMRNATNARIIGSFICHNAFAGIILDGASEAFIKDTMVCNQTFASGIEVYYGSHAEITNTTVHGNAHAGIWVIHPNTFALIENSTVYGNTWRGIEFHDGGSGIVKGSKIFNNSIDGIYIANTANVTVIGSNITKNNANGLAVDDSNNITILHSIFDGNRYNGIKMYNITYAVVRDSIFRNNRNIAGIWMDQVSNSDIHNNLFENNRLGLGLGYANGNTIRDNTFFGDGAFIWYPSTNTFENNTVNGKPLLYYENLTNAVLGGLSVGQVILVNPVNVTVRDFNISDVAIGIELVGGRSNRIIHNLLENTWDGINIRYSTDISVNDNSLVRTGWIFMRDVSSSKISNNYINGSESGIFLAGNSRDNVIMNNSIISKTAAFVFTESSSSNVIFLNDIYGGVYLQGNLTEYWHSPAPVRYGFRNGTFSGYLGNYWGDYSGEDRDENGIGDSPYVINERNADGYPLVYPRTEYRILLKGDINGDGRITATDALLYLRYVVGLDISPYHIDPAYDDLTGDGKITIADALKALRIAVGLEPPQG